MLFSINAKEKPKHIFAAMLLQEQKQLSSVKMGAMTNGVVWVHKTLLLEVFKTS